MVITAVEREIERLDNIIKAAEEWATQYSDDPDTHASLIRLETRLETVLRRFFRDMSKRADMFVNWTLYEYKLREVQAADDFSVDVMILDGPLDAEDKMFIGIAFDPVAQAIALGIDAGEALYSVEVGISQTSAVVQRTAKELVADLVGKKVDQDGTIVNNPKAKYRISDKTRADIRQSISTSLSLGEDQATAVERLSKTIKNPKRAALIARTESVNAYQRGILIMGQESGAVGKEWQSINVDDVCGTNTSQGAIRINDKFASGHTAPAAHPNCRCGLRLIYPEENNATLSSLTKGL